MSNSGIEHNGNSAISTTNTPMLKSVEQPKPKQPMGHETNQQTPTPKSTSISSRGLPAGNDAIARLAPPVLKQRKSTAILPCVTDVDIAGININEDSNSIFTTENTSDEDEEALQEILTGLISDDIVHGGIATPSQLNYKDLNFFSTSGTIDQDNIYTKYIANEKSIDEDDFRMKLKHFFILSSAGKPIYAFNGNEDIILGYMGVITTIVSSFEENIGEEIQSVTMGETKIVFLNKSPIILVAISKISYEAMGTSPDSILIRQLTTLYNYLLSILSKPLIDKNFQNRMNYDLRKILTPLDYKNLDQLCMKLTYGLPVLRGDTKCFDFFISDVLDSSLQSIKISKTIRTKLNNILLSCKRLKDDEEYVGEDLLFGMLMSCNKLISFMKPKNHTLVNEDIKILISMIQAQEIEEFQTQEDYWFPLCMPNFNPNGFLYIFVKRFDLFDNGTPQQISIILVSGNKNAFYQMQQLSSYIIHKIIKTDSLKNKLYQELAGSSKLSIINDIRVQYIKHFIYKLKKPNQFVMSNVSHFNNDTSDNSVLQLVYFYSNLHNNKALSISVPGNGLGSPRKLSYMRWNGKGSVVTGFMLSDEKSEFYCVCNENVPSKVLIAYSLRIIKWCEKYENRLFIGNGITF
jgi:hypothetical protein